MKRTINAVIIILLITNCSLETFAGFGVKFATPSGVLYQTESASTNKSARLGEVDAAINLPLFNGTLPTEPNINLNALVGDVRFLAIDIMDSSGSDCDYKITTNIPSSWELEIRRQAMVTDWYTCTGNTPDIAYYGDALPKLSYNNDEWSLPVRQGDIARLNLDFKVTADTPVIDTIRITVENLTSHIQIVKEIPINVYFKAFPEVAFNSMIHNNDGVWGFGQLENMWGKYGFTHFQIPWVPTFHYDTSGNVYDTVFNTSQTSNFYSSANEWTKYGDGGAVALLWHPIFDVDGGGTLIQWTEPWMNAYVQTVRKAAVLMRNNAATYGITYNDTEKVVLYIEDELGESSYIDSASEPVKSVRRFLDYLNENMPEYKTYITFGNSSVPADIDTVMPALDIVAPHFIMPTSASIYAGFPQNTPPDYNPAAVFKDKFGIKVPPRSYWTYMVEPGKNADIRDFRLLPMMAVLNGFEGLSWWAFSDFAGSTWVGHDWSIDYGMYYNKEPLNAVYNFWANGMDQTEWQIPSVRVWAAGAGIQDAKILKYLLNHEESLSPTALDNLNYVKYLLQSVNDHTLFQPERANYLSLEQTETISQKLRELYAPLVSTLSRKVNANQHELAYIVYPNPALTTIFVKNGQGLEVKNITCNLINIQGQVVRHEIHENNAFEMDVSNLAPGLYILEIADDRQLQRQKIVVR